MPLGCPLGCPLRTNSEIVGKKSSTPKGSRLPLFRNISPGDICQGHIGDCVSPPPPLPTAAERAPPLPAPLPSPLLSRPALSALPARPNPSARSGLRACMRPCAPHARSARPPLPRLPPRPTPAAPPSLQWLLAALACLAEHPDSIRKIFRTKEANVRGKYELIFYDPVKSAWVDMCVDDFIPCAPDAEGRQTPLFAQADDDEIWVMIIEKASRAQYAGRGAQGTGHRTQRIVWPPLLPPGAAFPSRSSSRIPSFAPFPQAMAKWMGSYAKLKGGHMLWVGAAIPLRAPMRRLCALPGGKLAHTACGTEL